MFRNLLATTAIATLVASGAYAQEATQPAPIAPANPAATDQATPETPIMKADGYLATALIGENVYNGTGDDAEHIGDVNDLVVGEDGNIKAVVVGVGGFLGIGEKDVAVDFAQLDWADRDGDRWLVAPMNKEQLEQQAAFDRSAYESQTVAASGTGASTTTTAPAAGTTAEAPAATTTPVPETSAQAPATATDTTQTAAIDKSTLKEIPAGDIRAEEMIGTTVYGADDANIGEIGDVVLASDGKVDAYLIDVGGFLGMGEKEVAVGSDSLAFMTDSDGNKYLYTTFTKEQLDAAPAYDKSSYAEKRDDQRLMMTR